MNEESVAAEILRFNEGFVARSEGITFKADKKPRKHLAIVTCMDTRLTTMFTAALGLENGDANIIKIAGAEVSDPFGAVMRSLLVAVYELGVEDIMVVAHTECGAQHMSGSEMTTLMKQAGITDETLAGVKASGIDLDAWLEGFGDLEAAVQRSVATIKEHLLMPETIHVYGFIIDTQSGELTQV